MADTKHTPTPGPWRVDDHPKREHPRVTDARGKFVADCDTEADARLVAAAPELLAALQAVAEQTRHPDYDWPVCLSREVSAAIAKAVQP